MPAYDVQVDRLKFRFFVVAMITLPLAIACSSLPAPSELPPPPLPVEAPAESAPATQPAVGQNPELERKLKLSELQLLEKQAQVDELQALLDDARQEVVRAMARQQSLASRAEAASAIAEAEIALQSSNAAAGATGAPEFSRLIQLSTAEFDRQNYAGALYLASQAKGAVAARGQLASVKRGPLRTDERPFASPFRLQTSTRANVREGPGGTFKVLFTLPAGTALTILSHSQQWVRVIDDSGRDGWIYQDLIDRRP